MILDIVLAILLVLALIRGYQRGLIIGIFSFVAIVIGIVAALKLSAVVAGYIGKAVKVSEEWLPLVSFIIVFIIVLLLVRLGARAIEKGVEVATLGWANKLGGMILYAAIALIIFSVILFYLEQMRLLQPETIEKSVTYSFVQPWGPKVVNGFGSVIPFFRGMFGELENFFGNIASSISYIRF
jgi:membrane protein required for colicin V production